MTAAISWLQTAILISECLKLDGDGEIPGCDIVISETNAIVTNIEDVVTLSSNAVPRDSQAVVVDTLVVPNQTTAIPVTLCSGGTSSTTTTTASTTISVDPTLVVLKTFTCRPMNRKVELEWSTEAEIDNAGFNIYRSTNDKAYKRINDDLIPAQGPVASGAAYAFVDSGVPDRSRCSYILEDV